MFSRRNEPTSDVYHYHFPEEVRSRLLFAIQHAIENGTDGLSQVSFPDVMYEVERLLLRKYGRLRVSGFVAARVSEIPAVEYFFKCHNEEVMDFLELCFKTKYGCGKQATVEALNEVLEECNVGYELTPYVETWTKGAEFMGKFQENVMTADVQHPKAIKKDEKVLHAETVKPSLSALSGKRVRQR